MNNLPFFSNADEINKNLPKYRDIDNQERLKLFTFAKTILGGNHAPFELKPEEMNMLLDAAIDDFSAFVQSWFVTQQFGNIWFSFLSVDDIVFAYTTKTLDFERSFSYAYSKQVGLGTNSPSKWELKKDFITIEEHQQVYTIPAGREVNEVLWNTPSFVPTATTNIDPFSLGGWSAGTYGWNFFGRPASVMQPVYSLMLSANDFSMKKRLLQSELTYRITGGANGTKNLYLYPIPGGRNEISTFNVPKHLVGTKVWYFYYDTTPENTEDCLIENPDIVLFPSQFPLKRMLWTQLNDIAKSRVRRIFTAEIKRLIGNIRGTYSGELKMKDFQLQMDYRNLIDQADKERDAIFEEMKLEMEKLTFRQLMEDRAAISESLKTVLKNQPFTQTFYTF